MAPEAAEVILCNVQGIYEFPKGHSERRLPIGLHPAYADKLGYVHAEDAPDRIFIGHMVIREEK